MSNWKLFALKSHDALNLSTSSNRSIRKYTPKKKKDQQIDSAIRLNNLSISKMHDSVMSGEQDMSKKEKQRLKGYNMLESRLKHTSSQNNVKDPLLLNKQSSDIKGVLEPIKPNMDSKIKQNNVLSSNFYDKQIKNIKKQFENFQQIILKELKRQEQYLNTMVEEITSRLRQGTIFQIEVAKIDSISSLTKQFSEQSKPLIKKINDFAEANKSRMPKLQFEPITTDLNNDFIQKNKKYSFKKFFDAMGDLKSDMKDLNKISDINSPRSARSHRKDSLQKKPTESTNL